MNDSTGMYDEIIKNQWTDRITALEAELAALNAPMECGHAARYAITEFAAKNGCAICDRDEWQELAMDNASTIQGDQVELTAARASAAAWKQAAKLEAIQKAIKELEEL